MAALWLPSDDRHTLALREPNLLVPAKKPVGSVEIDWSNPLTNDLVFLSLQTRFGDRNLVDGSFGTSNAAGAASSIINGEQCVSYNNGHQRFAIPAPDLVSKGCTFYLQCRTSADRNAFHRAITLTNAANTARISLGPEDSINIVRLNTNLGVNTNAQQSVTTTVKFSAFATAIEGDQVVYVNNIISAQTTNNTNFSTSLGFLDIGRWEGAVSDYLIGEIYFACFWNRKLSNLEKDLIHANPYQLLKPANDTPYLISVPTGGAITGTGSVASQSSAIAGTAEREITGTSALESPSSTISGTGAVGGAITGTASLAAQSSTIEGAGTRVITSAAELVSQASVIAGTAERAITGTSAIEAQSSSIAGTGTVTEAGVVSGTGALDSQSSTISGTGILARTGTGAIAAGVASIDATGIITRVGTGALAAQSSLISGTGTVSTPQTITGTGSLVCGVSSISGNQEAPIWTAIARVETVWTEI